MRAAKRFFYTFRVANVRRVVIAGAGVGGLSAALALHRLGVSVEIYEKYPGTQHHTTGFTLWSYAVARLAALGVGPEDMDRVGSAVEITEIRNQAGRLISKMPVGEVSRKLGAESYEVRRPVLLETLEARLPADTVRRDCECVAAHDEGETASLELADGSRVTADLVIGADGIHSKLRESVTGPTALHDSGYRGCAGVAEFSSDRLPPKHHIDIWGKGSKAGVGDIGHGLARWYLTWKVKRDAQFQTRAQILDAVRDWDPLLAEVVAATREPEISHHGFFDIPPIETWRKGRIVLIGDAAHATTPFAAMGANMTIEDVAVLVPGLERGNRVETALETFEAARKKRTEDVVSKGRTMARLTQLHSSFAAWLRDEAFLHMPPDATERVTREMASGE